MREGSQDNEEMRFRVFSLCVFLSVGKNELEYDKDYFGEYWTHDDELTCFLWGPNLHKDLEMDLEISPTQSSSPPSNHHPPVAREITQISAMSTNMHPTSR